MSAPAWATGMERVAPGIYIDARTKELHLSTAEILAANGWADIPENRRAVEEAVRRFTADEGCEFCTADDE